VFDQDKASAPIKLTSLPSPPGGFQNIYDIVTDAKGTVAAFVTGGAATVSCDLYTVQVGPPAAVHKVISGLVSTRRRMQFGPASKAVYHISMGTSGTWDLLGQPVTDGGVRVLRANLGKDSSVLAAW
jgi:hypothetical protein